MKLDFDDILLEPTVSSPIQSRKEIDVWYDQNWLPIIASPMDTVVDKKSLPFFLGSKIICVLPRNYEETETSFSVFQSYGLDEFDEKFLGEKRFGKNYVLIDIANGHMQKLANTVEKAKDIYGEDLVLMVGNVANPKTYGILSEKGADLIRVGIGNGAGCLTTVQTGVGYPMASLIRECYEISCSQKNPAKIVADGGFRGFADIIKALALGADFVMLGSILNKALESAGETVDETGNVINQFDPNSKVLFESFVPLYKNFRGMSTKEVQKKWKKSELTTSEGVVRKHRVEYTLDSWTKNLVDYLRSAMSYCGSKNLHEFIGKAKYNHVSQNSLARYKK